MMVHRAMRGIFMSGHPEIAVSTCPARHGEVCRMHLELVDPYQVVDSPKIFLTWDTLKGDLTFQQVVIHRAMKVTFKSEHPEAVVSMYSARRRKRLKLEHPLDVVLAFPTT